MRPSCLPGASSLVGQEYTGAGDAFHSLPQPRSVAPPRFRAWLCRRSWWTPCCAGRPLRAPHVTWVWVAVTLVIAIFTLALFTAVRPGRVTLVAGASGAVYVGVGAGSVVLDRVDSADRASGGADGGDSRPVRLSEVEDAPLPDLLVCWSDG